MVLYNKENDEHNLKATLAESDVQNTKLAVSTCQKYVKMPLNLYKPESLERFAILYRSDFLKPPTSGTWLVA